METGKRRGWNGKWTGKMKGKKKGGERGGPIPALLVFAFRPLVIMDLALGNIKPPTTSAVNVSLSNQ